MAEELAFLEWRHRTFVPVDTQTEDFLSRNAVTDASTRLARRLRLHVDVAIVGITAEAVAASFQFLVQIVQQQIRQER